MPSLQTARRIANAKTNNAKTLGQIYKEDVYKRQNWQSNDLQNRQVYVQIVEGVLSEVNCTFIGNLILEIMRGHFV